MKNSIGGEVKEISVEEFLCKFTGISRDHLANLALEAETQFGGVADEGLVLFENHDFSSSEFGNTTALVCGPLRSYTLEAACAGRLGDLPSRFKYPVAFCRFKNNNKKGQV